MCPEALEAGRGVLAEDGVDVVLFKAGVLDGELGGLDSELEGETPGTRPNLVVAAPTIQYLSLRDISFDLRFGEVSAFARLLCH